MLKPQTIRERVLVFMEDERPISMQPEAQLLACAVAAVDFLSGYTELFAEQWTTEQMVITPDLALHESEWALAKPLFLLYTERELAREMEASQITGMPIYVRSSSEILADIKDLETNFLPKQAFQRPILSFIDE